MRGGQKDRKGQKCMNMVPWLLDYQRSKKITEKALRVQMVAMRLLWVLEHVPGLREAADRGEAMFGCVDTCTVQYCTVVCTAGVWTPGSSTSSPASTSPRVSAQCGVMHPCHIVLRSVQHRGHGYIRPLHPPVRGLGLQHVQYPHGHDADDRGQRRRPLWLHQAG